MRKRRVVGVITARTHLIVQDSNLLLLISLGVRVRSLNSSSRGFRFSPQHKLKCATQYQQHVPRHRLRLLVQRFGQAWSGPVWSTSQRGHRCGYSLHIIYNTNYHNHHHQSLNFEGRWGTTDDFATSFLHFSLFSTALCGLGELQACPFPNVAFPPLPLSASSSSPFHCALQDGFGQTWWTGNMTIPLQFASLYDRQVFVWSNCLLDLGTDFLIPTK